MKYCCVRQCKNTTDFTKIHNRDTKGALKKFHKFPKDEELRKEWVRRLKIGRNPLEHQVVCSDHFKESDYTVSQYYADRFSLRKGSVPIEVIPISEFTKTSKPIRSENVTDIPSTIEIASTSGSSATLDSALTNDSKVEYIHINAEQYKIEYVNDLHEQNHRTSNVITADKSVKVKVEADEKGVQSSLPRKRTSYQSLNDEDLLYFTGLERERFEIVYSMLEKFNPIEDNLLWCKKNALLITLHKCRHNLDFKMMEFVFEVSRILISEIFKDVIEKLHFTLKQIDIWNISFKDSKSYRCILGCAEFFVLSAGDPNVHQLTTSFYKGHPTFKLLASCDELGAVNFISDVFCGSPSNREIVVKSGLLNKLEKEDSVMADNGFNITDLLEAKGMLNIPPLLRGKEQLSEFEVMKTRIIANRRKVIENVNCRAAKNKILVTPMQKCLWPYADQIIYVSFALVNFYKPLKEEQPRF